MTEQCTKLSQGAAQWCGERGEFVQFTIDNGPRAGDVFESTTKEFAKFWHPIPGSTNRFEKVK